MFYVEVHIPDIGEYVVMSFFQSCGDNKPSVNQQQLPDQSQSRMEGCHGDSSWIPNEKKGYTNFQFRQGTGSHSLNDLNKGQD